MEGIDKISSAYIPLTDTSISGSIGNVADMDAVIGDDDRVMVTDTTLFPYRAVCYIESTKGNTGTGAIIGRYRVLTCAHMFWDINTQTFYTGVVKPGYDAGRANPTPYGTIGIKRVILSEAYMTSDNGEDDWCILELESPIGDQTGWFGVTSTSTSLIGSDAVVNGYQGDLNAIYDIRQWIAPGQITHWTTKGFRYTCDTWGGASGSPVSNTNLQIIGVNANELPESNGGPRITSALYDKVMYTLMSCTYDIDEDGQYVAGVSASTTCLNFKNNLSGSAFVVKNQSGTTLGNSAIVGTGMNLYHNINGVLDKSYAIVIYGDVDGDGLVSVSDITELRSLIVAGNASGAYLKAGDLDGDGRLSSSDVVELRALIAVG